MMVSLEYQIPPAQIINTWSQEDYELVCLYLAKHGTARQVQTMQHLDALGLQFYAHGGKRFNPEKFTYEYRVGRG